MQLPNDIIFLGNVVMVLGVTRKKLQANVLIINCFISNLMCTKEVKNRSAPGDRYHGKINSSCAYSINVITLKFCPLIK